MNTGELRPKEILVGAIGSLLLIFCLGLSVDNGSLVLSGASRLSQTAWDDLRIPLSRSRTTGVGNPGYDTFKNGTLAFAFDKASDESLYFDVQMPHNYKLGTTLHAHIHWAPSDTNGGGVVWCLEYTLQEINGTFGASTTDCARQVGDGVAFKHQLIEVEHVTGVNTVSAVAACRLFRDADSSEGKGTDDYDADAFGLSFDFHYEIDSFGSRYGVLSKGGE